MGIFGDFFSSGQGNSLAPPAPKAVEASASAQTAELAPDPVFDPVKVLDAAGVGADKRQHVTRAQDLIRSLPADTPAAIERQIVEAAFRAFEVPLAQILDAAEAEISTYESFIRASEEHSADRRARGDARIAELEAEIEGLRENLRANEEKQRALAAAAQAEIARIQPVLDFFEAGLEVPPANVAGAAE
jgi:hypothetical protein